MHWIVVVLGIVIPIFHLLGAGFAIHATIYTRTSQGAIAWALSLIFFPYLAVPCYLVFGRQRFHGYVAARRRGDQKIDHLATDFCSRVIGVRASLSGTDERFGVFEKLTILPFTRGNSATLLVDGDATFAAIFSAIEKAQHYILVQFFIIRDDDLGQQLSKRLIERSKAGVKCYLLYDEIGSIGLRRSYVEGLRAAGVEVHSFNTQRGWSNRFQINFRNHRKIVDVDGQAAFVGGHNVGVEYVGKSHFGHWRDTHVELHGPAVMGVELSFLQDWHWATGNVLELPRPVRATAEANPENSSVIVVPTGPTDAIGTCTLMMLAAISSAKKRLWITSPYFVPDETVYDALQLAAIRGVDVRILLPNKADHLLVYLAAFYFVASGERAGVKFYRYQNGFLHEKVMLVDDDLAAIGTANLDNRSMRLNFEMTVFFADKKMASDVAVMLEKDFSESIRAKSDDLARRGFWFIFGVRLARLFSPIQ